MDYELVKSTLLEIIKEAKNLPENELEVVPGTNIKVKKGKTKIFDVYSYNYFEYINNAFIDNNIDYVTEIYNMLEKEVREENEEYFNSKAYGIYADNKEMINKLEILNKSLKVVNEDFVRLSNTAANLRNNVSALDYVKWKDKFESINKDIVDFANSRDLLVQEIVSIKNKVNTKFIKYIQEQMDLIEENFKNTLYGTEIAYALNGESVLASDLEEYNSLIQLLKIINSVNESEAIIAYQGVVCINEEQIEEVTKLFNKTNLFKRLETKTIIKKEENINNKLINDLINELSVLEEKSKKAKKKTVEAKNGIKISENLVNEYNSVLDLLKILNSANDSKWELVNVWSIANVKNEDKAKFEELARNVKMFNNLNPENEKTTKNEKLIKELKKYLVSLENKLNSYKGISNVPSRKTNNDMVVLKEDLFEYNTILEVISLLESSSKGLINVWDIAYIDSKNIAKFKSLVNATKYFENKIPRIEENEKEIINIKNELAEMIKKAKDADKSLLADNGLVLASDYEKYKLLERKYKYLEASRISDDLVLVNGVKIEQKYVDKYNEIIDELNRIDNNLNNEKEIVIPNVTLEEVEETSEKSEVLDVDYAPVDNANPVLQENEPEDVVIETNNEVDKNVVADLTDNKDNRKKKKIISKRRLSNKVLDSVRKKWNQIFKKGLKEKQKRNILREFSENLINSYDYKNLDINKDLLEAQIAYENKDKMSESDLENIDFEVENIVEEPNLEEIDSQENAENKDENIYDRIEDRVAKINSSRDTKYESVYVTPHITNTKDVNVVKSNYEEPKLVITLPTDEEILESISDKKLVIAQTDTYIDLVKNNQDAKEYRDLVYSRTGIDLDNYDMNNYVSLVQARSDVANAMNIIKDKELSKSEEIKEHKDNNANNVVIENTIPVITIPTDEEILESVSDKKLVIAQTDKYIELIKNNQNGREYRDLVYSRTGIDLDNYDMNNYVSLVQARSDVANAMNMAKEVAIKSLSDKARSLQMLIDEGLIPNNEKIKAEADIILINKGIEDLQKNERGI